MAKCLQHTGIKDYKTFISEAKSDVATAGNHLHKRFKKLFFTANDQNEGDTKDFEEALQTLQQDVLIGSSVLFTTFSNAADKDLIKYFRLQIFITDKIGASMEAKLLIPLVHNSNLLEMVIRVEDHQQLQLVMLLQNRKISDDKMSNEFAESMVKPLILCLQQTRLKSTMFIECFRCIKELELPLFKLFYRNKVGSKAGIAFSN